MISSFIDLQSLALFIILSMLFMIAAFRFDFKAMQSHPDKISQIFLAAGIIVGFSDFIIMLQDKEANFLSQDNVEFGKQLGVILLSPFYGVIFASVTWFGGSARKE
ncbi:MAG: hypothetical protein V4598_15060 [Bdellovibrionota bacterium]